MTPLNYRCVLAFACLVNLICFPQSSNAQQLPFCPSPSGQIGDWSWRASTNGPELTAKRFTLLTKGDFPGGSEAVSLTYRGVGILAGVLPGDDKAVWTFGTEFTRAPTNAVVTVVATGAEGRKG